MSLLQKAMEGGPGSPLRINRMIKSPCSGQKTLNFDQDVAGRILVMEEAPQIIMTSAKIATGGPRTTSSLWNRTTAQDVDMDETFSESKDDMSHVTIADQNPSSDQIIGVCCCKGPSCEETIAIEASWTPNQQTNLSSVQSNEPSALDKNGSTRDPPVGDDPSAELLASKSQRAMDDTDTSDDGVSIELKVSSSVDSFLHYISVPSDELMHLSPKLNEWLQEHGQKTPIRSGKKISDPISKFEFEDASASVARVDPPASYNDSSVYLTGRFARSKAKPDKRTTVTPKPVDSSLLKVPTINVNNRAESEIILDPMTKRLDQDAQQVEAEENNQDDAPADLQLLNSYHEYHEKEICPVYGVESDALRSLTPKQIESSPSNEPTISDKSKPNSEHILDSPTVLLRLDAVQAKTDENKNDAPAYLPLSTFYPGYGVQQDLLKNSTPKPIDSSQPVEPTSIVENQPNSDLTVDLPTAFIRQDVEQAKAEENIEDNCPVSPPLNRDTQIFFGPVEKPDELKSSTPSSIDSLQPNEPVIPCENQRNSGHVLELSTEFVLQDAEQAEEDYGAGAPVDLSSSTSYPEYYATGFCCVFGAPDELKSSTPKPVESSPPNAPLAPIESQPNFEHILGVESLPPHALLAPIESQPNFDHILDRRTGFVHHYAEKAIAEENSKDDAVDLPLPIYHPEFRAEGSFCGSREKLDEVIVESSPPKSEPTTTVEHQPRSEHMSDPETVSVYQDAEQAKAKEENVSNDEALPDLPLYASGSKSVTPIEPTSSAPKPIESSLAQQPMTPIKSQEVSEQSLDLKSEFVRQNTEKTITEVKKFECDTPVETPISTSEFQSQNRRVGGGSAQKSDEPTIVIPKAVELSSPKESLKPAENPTESGLMLDPLSDFLHHESDQAKKERKNENDVPLERSGTSFGSKYEAMVIVGRSLVPLASLATFTPKSSSPEEYIASVKSQSEPAIKSPIERSNFEVENALEAAESLLDASEEGGTYNLIAHVVSSSDNDISPHNNSLLGVLQSSHQDRSDRRAHGAGASFKKKSRKATRNSSPERMDMVYVSHSRDRASKKKSKRRKSRMRWFFQQLKELNGDFLLVKQDFENAAKYVCQCGSVTQPDSPHAKTRVFRYY